MATYSNDSPRASSAIARGILPFAMCHLCDWPFGHCPMCSRCMARSAPPARSSSGMQSRAPAHAPHRSPAAPPPCGRSSTASSTRSFEPGCPTPSRSRQKSGADMRDHIAQAVVTAMAAALLEPRDSGRQIDIIVHHQDLRRRDAIESATAATGAPLRFMNAVGLSSHSSRVRDADARQLRMLLARRGASCRAMLRQQRVDEPPARVVTRARVSATRDCRGRR